MKYWWLENYKNLQIKMIPELLHDMDYFLLRYGIDDVGVYVSDQSLIRKYYGVLTVYGEE